MWRSILEAAILSYSILSVSSCSATRAELPVRLFIPGECLAIKPIVANVIDDRATVISFDIHVNCDGLANVKGAMDNSPSSSCFSIPTKEALSQFGNNSEAVKQAYISALSHYSEIITSSLGYSPSYIFFNTVMCSGGITITANKPVAGMLPGENISVLFNTRYEADTFLILEDGEMTPVIDSQNDWIEVNQAFLSGRSMPTSRRFSIPLKKDYQVFDDDVTLTISIPVRIYMYLTWLSDRISDPDASMTSKEDILTCIVHLKKNLREVSL